MNKTTFIMNKSNSLNLIKLHLKSYGTLKTTYFDSTSFLGRSYATWLCVKAYFIGAGTYLILFLFLL